MLYYCQQKVENVRSILLFSKSNSYRHVAHRALATRIMHCALIEALQDSLFLREFISNLGRRVSSAIRNSIYGIWIT